MDSKPATKELIAKLAQLLRMNGDSILNGDSKLSLTTGSLIVLNECFENIREDDLTTSFEVLPGNVPHLPPAYHDTQFLYDFVQKTARLKLLHCGGTLQGSVRLAPFRYMKDLELKKTPLHLLEGLDKLRNKLTIITVSKCLTNLNELFESCGGDLSAPSTWPHLHTALLSYNYVEVLDTSLRLLPDLRTLDLSHNNIRDTDHCLEYLTELSMMNLSYNCLEILPTFSLSCRSTLSTLLIRNNCLEHIDGIQELISLVHIDLSHNCICDHLYLRQLCKLTRLNKLCLKGNPLSYHRNHRILTVSHLHPKTLQHLILDGQALSKKEQSYTGIYTPHASLTPRPNRQLLINSPPPGTTGEYSSLEQSYQQQSQGEGSSTTLLLSTSAVVAAMSTSGTARDDTTDTGLSSSSRKKKGKGKRSKNSRKGRVAEISDMDIADSTTEATTSGEEFEQSFEASKDSSHQMQQNVETLRKQLGPDWLYSLAVQNQTTNQKIASFKETNHSTAIPKSSTRASQPTNHSPESFKSTNEEDASSFKSFEHIPATEDDLYLKDDGKNDTSEAEKMTMELNYGVAANPIDEAQDGKDEVFVVTAETDSDKRKRSPSGVSRQSSGPSIYATRQKSETDQTEVDYGLESEPFIVQLYGADPATAMECIITVTDRYVLQKDLNGDVMDELDLNSLQSANVYEEDVVTDDEKEVYGDKMAIVKLMFDYIKRDRREKRYIMEDMENAQMLLEILKPTVQQKQFEAQYKDRLQCLKCGEEFVKQQAKRHVRKSSLQTKDVLQQNHITGDLIEGLSCPSCQSNMVIELDPAQLAKSRGSEFSTPVGSFNATTLSPLATSSTTTTPGKTETDDKTMAPSGMGLNSLTVTSDASSEQTCHTDNTTSSFQSIQSSPNRSGEPQKQLFKSDKSDLKKSVSGHALANLHDSAKIDAERHLRKNVSYQDFSRTSKDMSLNDTDGASSLSTLESSHTLVAKESDVVVRESGSDIKVLENPSNGCQKSAKSKVEYQSAIRESRSDLLILQNPKVKKVKDDEIPVIKESGSDLLILPNPSQGNVGQINADDHSHKSHNAVLNGIRRASSDFEVLDQSSRPSSLSTAPEDIEEEYSMAEDGMENSVSARRNSHAEQERVLSPCGSLSKGTVSAMVDHMYRSVHENQGAEADVISGSVGKSSIGFVVEDEYSSSVNSALGKTQDTSSKLDSSGNRSSGSSDIQTVATEADTDSNKNTARDSGVTYNYTNFTQVDHRIKLYLMMHLFQDDHEEFELILKCSIVQHSRGEEFPGILIMSSAKLYILKISGDESDDHPEKWLKPVFSLPVIDLQYVDIGPGYQSVRLEFDSPTSTFTLMVRDEGRCRLFIAQFTTIIQGASFSSKSRLQGITKSSQVTYNTMETLKQEVLHHKCTEEEQEEDGEVNDTTCKVFLAHLRTGAVDSEGDLSSSPVTLLVTPSHLGLAHENLTTLPSFCQPDKCGKQYDYKDRQKVTDITCLDLYHDLSAEATLHFLDESTNEEVTWCIVMETKEALLSLVKAIKDPWEEIFGVELELNTIDSIV